MHCLAIFAFSSGSGNEKKLKTMLARKKRRKRKKHKKQQEHKNDFQKYVQFSALLYNISRLQHFQHNFIRQINNLLFISRNISRQSSLGLLTQDSQLFKQSLPNVGLFWFTGQLPFQDELSEFVNGVRHLIQTTTHAGNSEPDLVDRHQRALVFDFVLMSEQN